MDKYRKSAEEIMRRGDVIIARQKQRSAVIKRTAFAISGLCAAVIAGVGIWNNPRLHNLADRTPPKGNYITDTTENNENQPIVTTSTSQTSALTTVSTENKIIVTSKTTTTEIAIVVTDKPTENTIPVIITTASTSHSTTSVTKTNTTKNSSETVTVTTSQSVDSSVPNTEQTATTSQPVSSSAPNQVTSTVGPDTPTAVTTATKRPTSPIPVTTKPISDAPVPTTTKPVYVEPGFPESIRIADVDFLVSPHNLDEVREITYNNVIYKNTYVTDIYDTIAYNSHEYLGWVYHNQKMYGDLFVIFNYLDNEHNLLIFRPRGSNEYFRFVPEEILISDTNCLVC